MLVKATSNIKLQGSEDWSALVRDNQTKASEDLKKEREM